ncbi:MAG: hypothetical protein IKL44_02555 [Clostridia bacterium]|nr:hypothetical protein [Clostridia bacterium]
MKKTLSIMLAVMMILGTLTVLTLIPAVADPSNPVNLVYNGDFEGIDHDGDSSTANKLVYDADDQATSTYAGEIIAERPIGWRVLSNVYSNAKCAYPSVITPAGYFTNYNNVVGTINQGAVMVQDVRIEAGKNYTVSAKLGYRPTTTNTTAETKWTIDLYLDAATGIANSDRSVVGTVAWSTRKSLAFTAIENTSYYGAGDFTDHSFTFSADEFIAANNLTAGADGKYHARLVINNYTWGGSFSGLVDDVTMYENAAATISSSAGGYITGDTDATTNDNFTVTAVPYYGNTFAGWYDGDNLVSASATYSGKLQKSIVAKFNIYNQVVDGNFEAPNKAGETFFNAEKNSANAGAGVVIDNPTTSTNHGDKILKLNPATGANTNADLVTIPFTAKKNTRYVMHLSYYSVDVNNVAYVGLFSENTFQNGWSRTTYVKNLTYHWEPEGTTALGNWTVFGGYGLTYAMMRDQTHASVNAGANKWIDYWVTFETGDETTIFATGEDTAKMFFLFGVGNSQTNTYYLDNVSITEAGATANDAIKAVAGENGTVSVAQPVLDSVCYVANNNNKIGTASTPVDGTVAYSQVAVATYTAKANNGYIFSGWYDENNNLVSTDATTTFAAEGTYTAKFGQGHACGDGGYLVDNGDGTVTAKAYYGNIFLGWYDGSTLATTDATVTNDGQYKYTATFAVYNQIVDGAFDTAAGLAKWQSHEYSNVFSIEDAEGLSGRGMNAYSNGNSMMAIQYPLTVKKNTSYALQFNMKIGNVTATSAEATPVWSPMISGSPDGSNWGNWPLLASYKITLQSLTDPSKQYVVSGFNTANIHQAHFGDLKTLFGNDWIAATIEIEMGDDTSYSNKGNLFANSDTATIYFALGHNFAKSQSGAVYDNMSFYEVTDTIEYAHKENVRPVRQGIGPVAPGNEYSFTLDKAASVDATVTHNGTPVTAVNGVYTVTLADTNKINVSLANDSEYPEMGKDMDGNDLTKYDHDLYTQKVWKGDTVYHETAVIYKDRTEIKLMHPVKDIISVRSYDLGTYYVEGYDFEINAAGNLVILPGSKIPAADWGITVDPTTATKFWESDDANVGITEFSDQTCTNSTIVITYKHEDNWAGATQTSVEDELDVFKKLRDGEDVHIVFYGDSMTSGWSASGGKTDVYTAANDGTTESAGLNYAPYAPNWMVMFIDGLKKEYPDADITWENLSLGGKDSTWGLANFEARYNLLNNKDIDLFLIGWGINDDGAGNSVTTFKSNQQGIFNAVRAKCADVSVLFYGANCTNTFSKMYEKETLLGYETANKEIAAAADNAAATNLTSIFMDIYERKEAACDLLSNNLNHANDFGCRIYAQTMLAAMQKKYTSTAATPSAPTFAAKDKHSVTLTAIAGYEYSMDGINWTTNNVFTGLKADTEYSFYQRVARTDDTFESAASAVLKVTTDPIVYTLGDVNADGVIDTDDVVLILQHVKDGTDLTEEEELAANANKDNAIDRQDAVVILAYIVGIRDSL